MKRLERCKGETSYHKIESDTDGESSPNSSGVVVTTSTPKKRSDSEQSRRCYSLDICDPRPPRSSNMDPGPTMLTVSPYLLSIFVLLATSVFVFAILILWSTRFYENGSSTIQNWWSPRPHGRNSGG
ncbi:uncharacterized protein LOC110854405 isoform X1 [Folsomia candida]|uniref:uncharacterized protein LOC110854405 isoform X1 n=1 Tax=Folsomia candida TaxID=158441 RepID=UPI000B8FE56C|nr:uncharacterized protein LOC110854405 isoform X1 [Folsomia candida]